MSAPALERAPVRHKIYVVGRASVAPAQWIELSWSGGLPIEVTFDGLGLAGTS